MYICVRMYIANKRIRAPNAANKLDILGLFPLSGGGTLGLLRACDSTIEASVWTQRLLWLCQCIEMNVHTNVCFNLNMYLAALQKEKKGYLFEPTK